MGLDNIAEEQKVKSELGVVFDTNYFSDDWKVSQVEKSISVFYPNWDSQKFADMLQNGDTAQKQQYCQKDIRTADFMCLSHSCSSFLPVIFI